jgi:hypothetical protein
METMSIPQKYRQIMTFWKYYSGEKVAPIPTIFSEYIHCVPHPCIPRMGATCHTSGLQRN